jgi:cell wall-associated NlpC family hydrolase
MEVRRPLLIVLGSALLAQSSAAAAPPPSWADAQIRVVTARGLMGGDPVSFRPQKTLSEGALARLVAGLSAQPPITPADPAAPVTMAGLDAALVRGMGLREIALEFAAGARNAGLAPPARFGTEVVARLLGLRTDHPLDSLELGPKDLATRAEAAYSAARILSWTGWEAQYVGDLATGFAPPAVSGWQQTVLREAVSLIGYPYVSAGTEERAQAPLGKPVPGGFDCSGLVWRIYKLAAYAVGTPLADTIQGRSTFAMSAEQPKGDRIRLAALEPGDVLFFGASGPRSKPKEIDHAGIYMGGGWMIHSSTQGVALAPLEGTYRTRFAWARRPLAEAGLTDLSGAGTGTRSAGAGR